MNQNITKDGRMIICEWYNTSLIDEQGKVIGIASMVIDITERIEAEHSLIESAERSRAIVKIIERMRRTLDMETIFTATTEELRLTLNSDRVAIYRFSSDWMGKFVAESVGERWVKLLQPDNESEIIIDPYLQETKGGRFAEGSPYIAVSNIHQAALAECHLELLDKLQTKAFLIVPIFCGNVLWGMLAIYQNSAPRKWQEEEINIVRQIGNQLSVALQQVELLKQTQNQALELMKAKETAEAANGAKSEFLARMSHELRTPLNAILGFAQIMNRSDDVSPQHQEFLSIINRSGEHLLDLINDILSMAKIESGQMQLNESSFDLIALLQSIEELLELKAQSKGLILTFIWDENVPQYIKTDENKLRQVLINLLGNAIKFTPSDGTISLSVKAGQLNSVVKSESLQSLIFAVEDTGPGIAPHEIADLFNPFVQTQTGRQSLQGTGLGLAISKQF
ncbi:MAG TPA: GAF domain-containing protein, partial [Allocoleopsis sp.]